MNPGCEVNEKDTRTLEEESRLVSDQIIDADEETSPCAEEDWDNPEHIEL